MRNEGREDGDGDGPDEQRQHQTADRAESAARIVGQAAAGDQCCRTLVRRESQRALTIVSHGPPVTSPVITSKNPIRYATVCPGPVRGRAPSRKYASSRIPANKGHSAMGSAVSASCGERRPAGRSRRGAVPGGLRAPRRPEPPPPPRDVEPGQPEIAGEEAVAGEGDPCDEWSQREEKPEASSVPATTAALDSTADSTEICRGVAPTSRMAANRCSRRAAASRVAEPMKMTTGKSMPNATTARIRSMPFLLMPTPLGQSPQSLGGVVFSRQTSAAPGIARTCATVLPTTAIRESGDGRPASPIVPTSRPG